MTLRQALQETTGASVYRMCRNLGLHPSIVYANLRGRLAFSKKTLSQLETIVPDVRTYLDEFGRVKVPD